MFNVQGEKVEKVRVTISKEEMLRVIRETYQRNFKKRLDIEVQNRFIMKWECTSYHNNDWEWTREREASQEEIERYAFWCQIKELFKEDK